VALALGARISAPSSRLSVARVLDRLHGMVDSRRPSSSTTDPSLRGRTLDAWACTHGVELRFIRPGKPIENAGVESFNGTCRDECLNEHWSISLGDAKAAIEAWRVDYNSVRPHSAWRSYAGPICRALWGLAG
jgi:putative transposase